MLTIWVPESDNEDSVGDDKLDPGEKRKLTETEDDGQPKKKKKRKKMVCIKSFLLKKH